MLQPVSGSNSSSSNNNQINNMVRQLNKEQEVKTFNQTDGGVGLVHGILPNNQGYGELLYDSTGLARIMMRVKNDIPELKVAKSGFDVLTTSDSNLIFNSNQDVFKIVGTGTIQSPALSIAAPGATYSFKDTITNFAHGLSYIPVVIGYINSGGQYYQLPYYFPRGTGTSGAIAWPFLQISADATNVSLTFSVTVFNQSWTSNAGDFPVKYYLLQETAN